MNELDVLVYKAEDIRQGETNVITAAQMMRDSLTAEEINVLKSAVKTDSGKFGDVLLMVFSVYI